MPVARWSALSSSKNRSLGWATEFGETMNCPRTADLTDWRGDTASPGWRKVIASIADLAGGINLAAGKASIPVAALTPDPLEAKPSIAVMPFSNLSGDADQEYFADGMVVEIATALSRIKSIVVIASGSSLAFKNKTVGIQDFARQLGVRYVLEGSVRKAGGRVRIVVQLADASDGKQIWTHRFDDTLDDIFALQDRVALSVAGVIGPAVQSADVLRFSSRPTANLGSYDLFLRALGMMRTYVGAKMLEVIEILHCAIDLDPNFGAALALAMRTHYLIYLYRWSGDTDYHRRKALELAARALRSGSDDAYVLSMVAAISAYLEQDLAAAVNLADRALTLNAGSAYAWMASGSIRILTAELEVAMEHLETSMRLDPVGPDRHGRMIFMAMARFQQRRFADAIKLCSEANQVIDNPTVWAILAASAGHLGELDNGRDALAHYWRSSKQPIRAYAQSAWKRADYLTLFLDGIACIEGAAPE